MESIGHKAEGPATQRFRAELKAFLQGQLGLQGAAIEKVADLTIGETKKHSERNNLDDLNDFAKLYLITETA
jgi:hypothetical protein